MESNSIVQYTPPFQRRQHNRTLQSGHVVMVNATTVKNHPSVYQFENVQPSAQAPIIKIPNTSQDYTLALTSQKNDMAVFVGNNPVAVIITGLVASAYIAKEVTTWYEDSRHLQKKKMKEFMEKNSCEKCQHSLSGGNSFLPKKNDLNADAYIFCPNCYYKNPISHAEYMSHRQILRNEVSRLKNAIETRTPGTEEYVSILESIDSLSSILHII